MPEEPRNSEDFDELSTPRPDSAPDPSPGRWCLLRHELPDGSWHYDLMIAAQPGSVGTDTLRPLFTLRLPATTSPTPGDPDCQEFRAQRIDNHRALYLDYQGPVSQSRGTVARLGSGTGATVGVLERGGRETILIGLGASRFQSQGGAGDGLLRFKREP